jgi:hypothetical protein
VAGVYIGQGDGAGHRFAHAECVRAGLTFDAPSPDERHDFANWEGGCMCMVEFDDGTVCGEHVASTVHD